MTRFPLTSRSVRAPAQPCLYSCIWASVGICLRNPWDQGRLAFDGFSSGFQRGTPQLRERGSAPKEGRHSTKTLLVKCPSVQWQPDGLTIHTRKWFLGTGFLGAPPISLTQLPAGAARLAGSQLHRHGGHAGPGGAPDVGGGAAPKLARKAAVWVAHNKYNK